MKTSSWIFIGVALSLVPIWRTAGGTQGLNLWQFVTSFNNHNHITYSDAVNKAAEAYEEVLEIE
jgi:hypothetical protein